MKTKVLLILAIILSLWFVCGDIIDYKARKSNHTNPCGHFSSSVLLWSKIDGGLYSVGNGVYIGNGIILTASHLANSNLNFRSYSGNLEARVLRVVRYPKLDVAAVVIDKLPELPRAIISATTSTKPYTLSTMREGASYTRVYAGNKMFLTSFDSLGNRVFKESMFYLNTDVNMSGDSGAALLDEKCRLVGIATGGDQSFLFGLRPRSYFINLQNSNVYAWVNSVVSKYGSTD